ncbi:MAG TPA: phospholipase [Thermoanaerobaculia bacterium]|nr:phospholipase [Thermoanaerobaculia bacterium]
MQNESPLVHLVRQPGIRPESADARPPLVILLHGVGANELQMSAIAPAFDPRCVVVSVRSPIVMGPSSFAWFHVRFTADGPVIVEREAIDAWRRVAAFAEEAAELYEADPGRVYVGGFSQGGIIGVASLLADPERFAGAFSMSGRLLPEVLAHTSAERVAGKPVLIVHGEHDDKLGVHLARWARERLEERGLAVTYREFPMGHEITRESLREVTSWLTRQLDVSSPIA